MPASASSWRSWSPVKRITKWVSPALAYPASFPFRLTTGGAEAANRSTEFLFLGISFGLAVGIVELWLVSRQDWRKTALALGGAAEAEQEARAALDCFREGSRPLGLAALAAALWLVNEP